MRVIVPIRVGWGRRVVVQEAIPVRALPFVSPGLPSPLTPSRIASNLAPETLGFEDRAFHDDLPRVLTGLRAHQLTEDLRIADVHPLEWDRIYDTITAAGQAEPDQLKCLPPGVFVWRRDFERAFDDYRQGFRGLTYDPLIPAELQGLVMEGFAFGAERAENPSDPPPAGESSDDDERGFHAGVSVEYRAKEGALGGTLSIAEIARLHPRGDDFAKRMLSAWLVYENQTTLHSSGGEASAPAQSVETGLKAFLDDKRMLDLFRAEPELTSGAALEELANQPQFGACVDVRRDDLRGWLVRIGEWPLPTDSLLARWWPQAVSGSRRQVQTPTEESLDAEDSGDPSADSVPPKPDTKGMVAWQAAALENWDAIEKERGPFPAARDVLKWLRDQGPRDVFPKEQPQARDTGEWRDGEGNRHSLRLESVSKRISEWRKWGWIPGRTK